MGDTLLCPSARVYRPQARETGSPKRRANQTAWRCGELNIRRKLLPMYPVQTVTHLSAGHRQDNEGRRQPGRSRDSRYKPKSMGTRQSNLTPSLYLYDLQPLDRLSAFVHKRAVARLS